MVYTESISKRLVDAEDCPSRRAPLRLSLRENGSIRVGDRGTSTRVKHFVLDRRIAFLFASVF